MLSARERRNGVVSAVVWLFLCLFVATRPAFAEDSKSVSRLGGESRWDTMASIVDEGFAKSTWAVVATGQNYPDALSASALAGALHCPVILTNGLGLSPQASQELSRLGVRNVYLLGGPNVMGASVESSIRELGINVERLAGTDRADTSLKAMAAVRTEGSTSDTVVIATGGSFADSLSIGPWSYRTASPIVLASDGVLSQDAVDAIRADARIRRIVIVGGASAVRETVMSQLGEGSYSYKRLWGENRYETSRRIAEWETSQGLTWSMPAVATGQNFPDALAGAAFCGSKASPLLLTSSTSFEASTLVGTHARAMKRCYVLGGTSAVSSAQSVLLYRALNDAAVPPAVATDAWTAAWAGLNDAGDHFLYFVKSDDGKTAYLVFGNDSYYWDFFGDIYTMEGEVLGVRDFSSGSFEFQLTGIGTKGELFIDMLDETGRATLRPCLASDAWSDIAEIMGVQ